MHHYRDSLTAAISIILVLNTLAIFARLYSRLRITRSFGWDDVMLCVTYIGYLIICGLCFTAFRYGYAAEDEKPYSTLKPSYDPAKAKEFYFATQLTIYIDSGLIKLAVALVLIRIATTKTLRLLLAASMVVVVVWTIVMTIYASDLCAAKGTSNYAGSTTCNVVGYFRTVSNIIIDYFYALLPVYILWSVKMRLILKLSVMLLLGLGIFASASTIVKLVIIIRLNHSKGEKTNHLHYELLLWAIVELGMAIFAATMAAVRPLLSKLRVPGVTKGSTGHSSSSGPVLGSGSDAAGPYGEIGYPAKGFNDMNGRIERQVVIDVESHEMRNLRSGEVPLENRAAAWTDNRNY